ncbi:putative toxin-antitoxin system toxin component, PIN family [Wenzhouxiangella sp. XN79A]|nr:putative toxin-antitoxin system toxin component, PIN family [Wenzhouxiangella sp. XN79A]
MLISAVLSPSGAPANLLARLVRARSVLVFSEPTMNELATRMLKSKFDRYVDRSLRVKFLAELDAIAEIVGITGAPMGCRDRDDDMILETALNAEAPLIVTGDADLLSMNPWRDIRIISPAEAIEFF